MKKFIATSILAASQCAFASAGEFVWPVGQSNELAAVEAPCSDNPTCYWLTSVSGAAPDQNKVWRDSQPFQRFPLTAVQDPSKGKYHLGADFNLGATIADEQEIVRAVARGEVIKVAEGVAGFGNMVFIKHATPDGPITSVYAHVDWLGGKKPGLGLVEKGAAIAEIGDGDIPGMSPHLHFEIRIGENTTPGCAYTSASYSSNPDCATESHQVKVGPQGQVDPVRYLLDQDLKSRDASFDVQFESQLGAWNLPPESKLLPVEKCSKEQRKKAAKAMVILTSTCQGATQANGIDYLWFRSRVIRTNARGVTEGNTRIVALTEPPVMIGQIQAQNGIVPTLREGQVEFLAIDYTGWNADPAVAPFDHYRLSEAGNGLALISASPVQRQQTSSLGSNRASTTSTTRGTSTKGDTAKEISCNAANWEGVVNNVADLFECDSLRAIQALSDGRRIRAYVAETQFSNGSLRFIWYPKPTYVSEFQRRLDQKGSSWDDWLNMTQNYTSYTVACALGTEHISRLREGNYVEVEAKLVNLSGESISLQCTP